ncbi:2-nitropropane dioxygenase [bacterium NHP-B]|nr:2-nitropropane dioxygenase [bacterium NHP-B]
MLETLYPFLHNHPQAWRTLASTWKKGTDFLGTPLALLGGAMTWVSDAPLVAAMSNAGAFGVLASGAMSPSQLQSMIQQTQARTTQPFGVNLILMHPKLEEMIDVCQQEQISHVFFAGGLPTREHMDRVSAYGGKPVAFAPTVALGKRLVQAGAEALIIEGTEAGGHIGPVSSSVLAQEILPTITDVPVFAAGGIGSGSMVMSYLHMGAAGCQLGTRLVCAEESSAHPNFKKAFIRAHARDAVVSQQLDPRFPVIPVRALKNKGMQAFMDKQKDVIARFDKGDITRQEGQLEIEHFWAGALRRAVCEGDVEHGSLMAGQSVGQVRAIEPLKDILAALLTDMLAALEAHPPQAA